MLRRGHEGSATERLLLLRIVASGNRGAAPGVVLRDLSALHGRAAGRSSWRKQATAGISRLMAAGRIAPGRRSRLVATPEGRAEVCQYLGFELPRLATWPDMRDIYLVARALGIAPGEWKASAARLAGADGLRVAILSREFALGLPAEPSMAAVRNALAAVALERGFGAAIVSRLGSSPELPGRTGRAIAAELLKKPRNFLHDRGLIAALAAECAGAKRRDPASLRAALTSRLFANADTTAHESHKPARSVEPQSGVSPEPPDLVGFSREVSTLAKARAEGWSGNRRAYISHVWQAVRESHPEWGLDVTAFKGLLSEAHRRGHIVLSNADLRDQKNIADIRDSAVKFKNMEWHFIRASE